MKLSRRGALALAPAILLMPLAPRFAVAAEDAPKDEENKAGGGDSKTADKGKDENKDKGKDENKDKGKKAPSPEEFMASRYPQPVQVGFLIGLPFWDWSGRTVGTIRDVARAPDGKIKLIVPFGGLFGFGARLIPIPIETAGMLGRAVATTDLDNPDFAKLPTWTGVGAQSIDRNTTIQVALTNR